MNTPNHQTIRQQLWCNIATALATDPTITVKDAPAAWADHILKAFDERFPEPPVKTEPPAGLPPLPPVPEGYDRWVYRGMGWSSDKPVYYGHARRGDTDWGDTSLIGRSGGCDKLHYIEAVKGGDQ
jgi:hypothetical protein